MEREDTHYVNTDLALIAPHDLAPLAIALSDRGVINYRVLLREDGSWSARFRSNASFPDPDQDIAAMLDAIESLDESSRRLWDASTYRAFDIGYHCGDKPWGFNQSLPAATLVRIAVVGADIEITLYPAAALELPPAHGISDGDR